MPRLLTDGEIIEFKGQKFKAVPEIQDCKGCAFEKNEESCEFLWDQEDIKLVLCGLCILKEV